jgi:hypothetical protein
LAIALVNRDLAQLSQTLIYRHIEFGLATLEKSHSTLESLKDKRLQRYVKELEVSGNSWDLRSRRVRAGDSASGVDEDPVTLFLRKLTTNICSNFVGMHLKTFM